MEDNTYSQLFYGNFIIASQIKDELERAGIVPVVKDESESGRLAGFGSSFQGHQELYVRDDEFEKALRIVERVNSELNAND